MIRRGEVGPRQPKVKIIHEPTSFINKNPKSFTLLDETHHVKYWCDILLKVCEIMRKKHSEEFEQILLNLKGSKHPFFSLDKKQLMQGQGMLIPGTRIYAATKLHNDAMVDRCKLVIQSFGDSPSDLQIETRDS